MANMTNLTIALSIGACVLLQAALAWWLVATRRELTRVTLRLQRHADALTMLTDTSETGFGAMAREIARLGQQTPAPVRKTGSRRGATSQGDRASRGRRRTNDEAVADAVVEGARPDRALRLHLA